MNSPNHKAPIIAALAVTAAALTAACSSQDTPTPHHDPQPEPIAATAEPATSSRPPQIVQERACGAFGAINDLAYAAINPNPDPGNPAPKQNGTNIIAFANALARIDTKGLPTPMSAAINAHAYALTNLGALINHGASRDDIGSMATVADTTGRTVQTLCDAP